jgi:tetratricopeptide (TPR) repeat protein
MQDLRVFFVLCALLIVISFTFSQQYDYRDADMLLNDKNFEEAARVYTLLLEQNPYNGYLLQNLAYTYYAMQQYEKAIENYKMAIEAGYENAGCMYNIACCYSKMNKPKEAVEWLKYAAINKFNNLENSIKNDGDFDNIRNSDIFKKEVMPSDDMFKTREDGWKTDLRFMKKRMEETHYNINGKISKDEWEKMFEELSEKVNDLDDSQMFTEMLKITSKVGDGHTTVYSQGTGRFKASYLPFQFFMFEDGLYIIQASPEYKELAGKKVLKIGNTDANDILGKIRVTASLDNELAVKWIGMYQLTINDVLYGLGITNKKDEAELTLEGNEKVTVKSATEEKNPIHSLHGRSGWIKGWKTDPAPIYLKDRGNLYWYEYVPDKKLVFMQLNGIGNQEGETLKDFSNRVFNFIDSGDAEYFVLDIRFNGGGNNTLNKSFVQRLIKCDKINQPGKFFTIIGRNTFSAAQCLTNDLENQTNVIFAGEPTGSKPDFVGESSMILLPYSGLMISCSSRYWQSYFSDDYRKWVAPQLGVKYFYSDYKNGIDPAMDAILNFINKK